MEWASGSATDVIVPELSQIASDIGRTGVQLLIGPESSSNHVYRALMDKLQMEARAGRDVTNLGVTQRVGGGVDLVFRVLADSDGRWIRLEREASYQPLEYRERGSCISNPLSRMRRQPPRRAPRSGPIFVNPVGKDTYPLKMECGAAKLIIPLKVTWEQGEPVVRVEEFHVTSDTRRDMYLIKWTMKIRVHGAHAESVWPGDGPQTGFRLRRERRVAGFSAQFRASTTPFLAEFGTVRERTTIIPERLSLFATGASISEDNEVTLTWDTRAWTYEGEVGFPTEGMLCSYLQGNLVPAAVTCKLEDQWVGGKFLMAPNLGIGGLLHRTANLDVEVTAEFRGPRRRIAGQELWGYYVRKFPIGISSFEFRIASQIPSP